jgi:hypothetical protein
VSQEELVASGAAPFDGEIVVMYFGAGRGPLIRKALKAAERA